MSRLYCKSPSKKPPKPWKKFSRYETGTTGIFLGLSRHPTLWPGIQYVQIKLKLYCRLPILTQSDCSSLKFFEHGSDVFSDLIDLSSLISSFICFLPCKSFKKSQLGLVPTQFVILTNIGCRQGSPTEQGLYRKYDVMSAPVIWSQRN
jgi:hypothetical protein